MLSQVVYVARIALASLLTSVVWATQEAPQTFTFDGRAYADSSATTPMLDNISTRIQILNAAQDCILYEETQSVSTTATNGYFTIQIGSASGSSKRSSNDSGHSMGKIFSNTSSAIAGKLVSNGAACSYTPVNGEKRYVRLQMTPAADNVTRTISPNMAIDSVPSAIVAEVAESLRGLTPANFIQVNNAGSTALSQANIESLFSTTNFLRLTSLTSVAPTNYVQTGSNGSISIPSVAGNPASALANGQIWYDSTNSVMKYYDGAVKTLGTSASGFANGGNSFGAAANLGTNDNFGLNFKTNNATQMNITAAGNVGIGTSSPRAGLDVNSTILGKPAVVNATATIDFSNGNIQYTSASCGSFQFNNLKDGGSYTFIVQGTSATTCAFTGFSDAGTTALTVHMPPDIGASTAGKHTVFNVIVGGTHAYVAWTPGY